MKFVLKYWFRLLSLSFQNVFNFVYGEGSLASGEERG